MEPKNNFIGKNIEQIEMYLRLQSPAKLDGYIGFR